MPTIPPGKRMLDRSIRDGIQRQRLARGTERKILELLEQTMRSVKRRFDERIAWIASRGYDTSDYTLQRLEENLRDLRRVIREGYRQAGISLRSDLLRAGKLEMELSARLLRTSGIEGVNNLASRELLVSLVEDNPFRGKLLKEWARTMEHDGAEAIKQAIREGLSLSEPPQKVVQRIVGKYDRKTRTYRGGLVDGAIRRDVSAVVQTAYGHVQAGARQAVYEANSDLIEYQIWLSTLDEGTTDYCRIRNGLKYTLDGRGIGHRIPWGEGPGRAHWNCRSDAIPSIVGVDDPELESFQQWFRGLSREEQIATVGVTRYKMWRRGDVALDRLYNARGRWLRIEEVERREGVG